MSITPRNQLIDALESLDRTELAKAVMKYEGISPETAEALERSNRRALQSTVRKVLQLGAWVAFYVFLVLVIIFVCAAAYTTFLVVIDNDESGNASHILSHLIAFMFSVLKILIGMAVAWSVDFLRHKS